ncbi:hypothetical protein FBALC1_14867 [Flavobacteriales bacterium ALC-1]|nr:hypothetical protein FBALC1_14867 [Flavobacteriales bacterium ALC-1]
MTALVGHGRFDFDEDIY